MDGRAPDFELVGYLQRWHSFRTRWGCLYVHRIVGSDRDDAMHDHRSFNVSVVLRGGYVEYLGDSIYARSPLSIVFRRATTPHRIVLIEADAVTLFLTGPHQRDWGFHTADGWVHWSAFESSSGRQQVRPTPL